MDIKLSTLTLNRKAFSVAALDEDSDAMGYWLAQSPEERLMHVELLRRINYGHRATERLQRVLEVAELVSS